MHSAIHSLSAGAWCMLAVQVAFIVLFGVFVTYDEGSRPSADGGVSRNSSAEVEPIQKSTMFMDIHVMIFVGFGFLMTFMKRYSFGGLAFNFLLASLVLQWYIIVSGLLHLNDDYKITIGLESLIQSDVAAAAVAISMGALLGRTTFVQLLVMGLIEIVVYSLNWYLAEKVWKISDVGGSIFVHTFGAYFGLAVSWALHRGKNLEEESGFESVYNSDIFAMIGTVFLWVFWPSFNAADAEGDGQQRAIIHTYLALSSCCVVAFLVSYLVSGDKKFDMVHIQNSTLAGGVAVGTVADRALQPWGALLAGAVAGALSVLGYARLAPVLARRGLPDTCGVHNLHGMPGVLSGLLGVLLAALNVPAQAAYQLYALLATLAIAITTGLITGVVIRPLSHQKADEEESKTNVDDNFWIIHKAE